MKKSFLWSYIISSAAFLISLIVYIVLFATKNIKFELLNFLFNIIGIIIVWLPVIVLKIIKTEVNILTLVSYHIFVLLAVLVGSVWKVYDKFSWYDIIVHSLSGVIISLIAYSIFVSKNKDKNLSLVWIFVIAFSICMMCGAVWEIWEFTTDGILNGNTQRFADVSGTNYVGRMALMDTMIDIICNTVGAIIGSIFAVIIEFKQRKKLQHKLNTI